jgi:hypothetical protein
MRSCMFVFTACAVFVVSSASAHGPQIQVTDTGNKITTREVVPDAPYGGSLTNEKSVYVLPILKSVSGSPSTDYWAVMPNNTIDPITLTNSYPFGPGLAYGYGHTFTDGFHFNVSFTDSLKKWNGSAFVSNPGVEAVGAFRGDSTSSLDQVIIGGGSIPGSGLVFSNIASTYNSDSHSSMRFRLLGDGASALTAPSDGIYLLKLQISSTQPGLDPSSVLSFLLYKNASYSDLNAAVSGLGVNSSLVQFVGVPEPATGALAIGGFVALMLRRRVRRSGGA